MDKRYFNSKVGLILKGCLGILFRCGAARALYKADKLDMKLPIPREPNKLQKWLWKKRWFKERLQRYLWKEGGWSETFERGGGNYDCFLKLYSLSEREVDRWFMGDIIWYDLISKFEDGAVTMVKCPVPGCGSIFKNVGTLAKHISYIAQSSEIWMGRDIAGKHKRWLGYKGVNVDYESVKRYLKQIKDEVLIFQDC